MKTQLSYFQENGQYISIYTNREDTRSFMFGKVLALGEEHMLLFLTAPNGSYDGVVVKEIADVYRIEADVQYATEMLSLMDGELPAPAYLPDLMGEDLISAMASAAKRHNRIVSIELLGSRIYDAIGFVESVSDGIVKVNQVDANSGTPDGYTFLRLEDITEIEMDSEDERLIERLYAKAGGNV